MQFSNKNCIINKKILISFVEMRISRNQWNNEGCHNITEDNKCFHKHGFKLVIGGNFNLNIVVRAKEYRWRYKVGGEFHNYKHVVTPKVIQYINVAGLEKREGFAEIIKLDKLY
uniref:Uncharacterized protein n=1 Tax=Meloidogyne enterolobii TaxID=390850 RepID=A0A6V7UIA8_MELEN|nr:unnamed protein product [Meloidogyne enterolobii]